MKEFQYIFGPIPSRRLGRSLGISPLPKKTCNYSCIYCQLGRTDRMTNERQEFYKTEDILKEFRVQHDVWFSETSLYENNKIEPTIQKLKDL